MHRKATSKFLYTSVASTSLYALWLLCIVCLPNRMQTRLALQLLMALLSSLICTVRPFLARPPATSAAAKRIHTLSMKGVDLWVIGAGELGKRVIKQWKEKHPRATVVAETATDAGHAELQGLGAVCRTRAQRTPEDNTVATHIVYCIPPSGGQVEYAQDILDAMRVWKAQWWQGRFVFTSSGGVYSEADGGVVNENSPVSNDSPLFMAENMVFENAGVVVRLAGLYHETRGPHSFWLNKGSVSSDPSGLINLIHYDDAAALVIAAIERGVPQTNYLGSDDQPLSRIEICASALASPHFAGKQMPTFSGVTGPMGKRYNSSWTREQLGFVPKHSSFVEYMRNTQASANLAAQN